MPTGQVGRRAGVGSLMALACLAILAGCSGTHKPPRPGTISGGLIAEYSVGGTGLGSQAMLNLPQRGRIEILSGNQAAFTLTTTENGAFRISVPAGRYTFRLLTPAKKACSTDPAQFSVRPGKVSEVQVFCQLGAHEHMARWFAPPR